MKNKRVIAEKFLNFIREIEEYNTPVIVEGKKDKSALEEFGLTNIITLHKKPIYQIVEELKVKEVVILTDLDREGKKLYGILTQECNRLGIKINNKLRNFLLKETELSHVEGLRTYINNTKATDAKNKILF